MTDLRKRIEKVEASLNKTEYSTLEDIVSGETSKPLSPEMNRIFLKMEERCEAHKQRAKDYKHGV